MGIAKGGVKNRNKGGCKRLFAFVHVCSRLLAFACVFASAFACVCLRLSAFFCVCFRLLAFAYAPLCRAPLCVTLIKSGKEKAHKHKQSLSGDCPGGGGGLPIGWSAGGQTFMCCVRNPRNIKIFVWVPGREDRWPGWPSNCLCATCSCAFFWPLLRGLTYSGRGSLKTVAYSSLEKMELRSLDSLIWRGLGSEMRHSCLKHLKCEMHACKTR